VTTPTRCSDVYWYNGYNKHSYTFASQADYKQWQNNPRERALANTNQETFVEDCTPPDYNEYINWELFDNQKMVCSLNGLRTDALDGELTLVTNSMDYRDEHSWEQMLWTSNLKVKVEHSMIDVISLIKAAEDLREQHDYWGQFIEQLTWDSENNRLEVSVGS